MENTIILIDAGFLSKLSKYFGNGKYLDYNLVNFSENLAKKQNLICKKIFYYTAPPFQTPNSTKEEQNKRDGYDRFVNKLRKNGVEVREGRCQRLKLDGEFVYGQKGVDALAIIDLMSIPFEHKDIKKVLLIANDSDFVPAINKLKDLDIEVILYTYYPKKRESSFSRNNELLKTVLKYIRLSKADFDNSPLLKEGDRR